MIPRGKRHLYPANGFCENRKSLFIAEPCSDFNRCYEQRISKKAQVNTIYSSLCGFEALQRTKDRYSSVLTVFLIFAPLLTFTI